jgi:uroporphyrinogen decarboxylase
MTSKERVHAALKKQSVDRVPIFMWYHPQTAKRLAKLLEIPPHRLSEALGDDVRMTWVSNNFPMEGIVHEQNGDSHVDEWGVEWTRIDGFNQITHFPIGKATPEEVLNYRFPNDKIDSLLGSMIPINALKEKYFIGCDVSPSAFELYWRLRGMENAMMDLITNPDVFHSMIRKCADFTILLSEKAIDRFDLDWLWAGDDVGGQDGMILNPVSWREIIKPQLERVFNVAKKNGIYAAFHSCGGIRPIIGDLVEIGMEVLNPIQCNCAGMDPLELKKEFGKDLTFMGGIDTQELLPNGTAEDVFRETTRLIEGMTFDGGGYILAASHTIPPETPDENIFAMYKAAGLSREQIFDNAVNIRNNEFKNI